MDMARRPRSNSMQGPEHPVELTTAQNSLHNAPPTVTVSASDVRGFTQATANQRPTVYFNDPFTGAPSGRATQEHGKPENVGAHPPHQEAFFGNVPTSVLRAADRAMPDSSRTDRNLAAVNHHLTTPLAGPAPRQQLVELFGTPENVTGSHRSRGEFHDLTTNADGRAEMVRDLRKGPLNVNSLSRTAPGRAQDDWHVKYKA